MDRGTDPGPPKVRGPKADRPSVERATPLTIGGQTIAPGERATFDLPVALLPTHTAVQMPLAVLHGKRPGPCVWVSAAVHGDELNGVEIIRRVLDRLDRPLVRGTVIFVPIVNVFGFLQQSRYLPDGRDLNRSFPGSQRGSLASRVAHLFLTEIVERCTHGIDLHTASSQRSNLPQIRANLGDPETLRCALAFGAPVMVDSNVRDGSLRAAAAKRGISVLLYEAGEAQRFNAEAIGVGVEGVLGVFRELGLIKKVKRRPRRSERIDESRWVRARRGGLLRLAVEEGERVEPSQVLGTIADPLGGEEDVLRAPFSGRVIGLTRNPVVHGGDAVLHIGRTERQPLPG